MTSLLYWPRLILCHALVWVSDALAEAIAPEEVQRVRRR